MLTHLYRDHNEIRMDKLTLHTAEILAENMDSVACRLSDRGDGDHSNRYPRTVEMATRIAALCRCLTEAIGRYEKYYEMERARELADEEDLPF